MRYALSPPNVDDAAAHVRLAEAADASGWDGVFLWDHLHMIREYRLRVLDPWVLLGAMAARTERVRLGALVTPVARRRPWKLAKEIVTLDHLSGGRAVVGVGLGEPGTDEFEMFGESGDPRVRAAKLDEGLAILDAVFRGEPFVFEGEHFRVDAELLPPPVQRPRPPVWVAAMSAHRRPRERALRWDGIAPVGANGEPMSPDDLAAIVTSLGPLPEGFDVVATAMDDVEPEAYAEAGATWLVWSSWPVPGWYERLYALAEAGPPAR